MAECEPSIEQLQADLDAKRRATAADHVEQIGDIAHRRTLARLSAAMPPLTSEQIAAREAEEAAREHDREQYARYDRWRALVQQRGERYSDCRLSTFDCAHANQGAAVGLLCDYCGEIADRIAAGEGIVLFGPKGTGKDHLAMAVARVAISRGKSVTWQNGMDLFGDIRDSFDDSKTTERAMVARLVQPDVLYLSDPLPPMGNLTEFQASMLFRVLDGRYSRRRPTWVTVNVQSGAELDTRLGPQNGDRLRDGALAIFCDWQSYRKVK